MINWLRTSLIQSKILSRLIYILPDFAVSFKWKYFSFFAHTFVQILLYIVVTVYSTNCLVYLIIRSAKTSFIFPYFKHFYGAIFSWLSFNILSKQHLTSLCVNVFQNDEQTRHPRWDDELGSYDQVSQWPVICVSPYKYS